MYFSDLNILKNYCRDDKSLVKLNEFADLLVKNILEKRRITFKESRDKRVISIREGKLIYNMDDFTFKVRKYGKEVML
ncbi:MAG: hypothetical protein EOM50_12225 [Erysipelotrichia bacterium]|nr:hypothetical protein [Erysipelotrichia bacterium]